MSESVTNGTSEVVLMRTGTNNQGHAFGQSDGERPADVPSNWDPQAAVDPAGDHYQVLHWQQYGPAVDAQGNADCQTGQTGYINGPLARSGHKYAPAPIGANETFNAWENAHGGGSHTTYDSDIPGLAGGSFVARKLGIDNLKAVP
jgi:hypothetical protein